MVDFSNLDRELSRRNPSERNIPNEGLSLQNIKKDFDDLANLARTSDLDTSALVSMRDLIYFFLKNSGLEGEEQKFLEWSNSFTHYVGTEQYENAVQLLSAFEKANGSEKLEKVFKIGIEELAEARGSETSTRTKESFLGR